MGERARFVKNTCYVIESKRTEERQVKMGIVKDMIKVVGYCVQLGIKEGVKSGVVVGMGCFGMIGGLGAIGLAASKIQKH